MVFEGDDGRLFQFIKSNIVHFTCFPIKIKAKEIFIKITQVFSYNLLCDF